MILINIYFSAIDVIFFLKNLHLLIKTSAIQNAIYECFVLFKNDFF